MRVRLIFALTLSLAGLVILGGATATQAAPGSLRILNVNNRPDYSDFTAALRAKPGVAAVDVFDSSVGTPTPETLATYDLVAESGAVEKVNIVSGNPVLTRPASDAVKKWKFAPFTSDGKPVKAVVPVSLSFKM